MDIETSWPWMILVTWTLGLRHGLDLDHIATIDAITRTVRDNQIFSKTVGLLFSLGHGIVVTLISIIIGAGIIESHVPEWLEGFGNWISISFLALFGALNLWNVFQKTPSSNLPVGIKNFLVKKIIGEKQNPFFVVGIGALFAFSFDTFSQIALFAISASLLSGWGLSAILGLSFTIGMVMTDGFNGFFVSTLIQRADRTSLLVSRGLGLVISIFSFAICASGLLKILL